MKEKKKQNLIGVVILAIYELTIPFRSHHPCLPIGGGAVTYGAEELAWPSGRYDTAPSYNIMSR